ncbi:MAG: hypothetical protein ACOZE5_08370 [Verrucomicrobiota bacterium]
MVMQPGGQAEFVSVGRPPIIHESREGYFPILPRLLPQTGQFLKQMKTGEVAAGKFGAEAADEQGPPDRGDSGETQDRAVTIQMSEKVGLEPLAALGRPEGPGAAALRGAGFCGKALPADGEGCFALLAESKSLRATTRYRDGREIVVFGHSRGSSEIAVGLTARGFVGRLRGGLAAPH